MRGTKGDSVYVQQFFKKLYALYFVIINKILTNISCLQNEPKGTKLV